MPNYVENLYNMLKRKGYAAVFEHAGIYKISIDGIIAYIGKSENMLWRLAQHYVAFKEQSGHKYKIFAEAKKKNHVVNYEVIYYAKSKWKKAIIEEIGEAEGRFIRQYMPPLNWQIPKKENWRKFDTNPLAKTVTLDEILQSAEEK